MSQEFYQLNFYGLKRQLPLSHLSPKIKIANFNILGDVEFTEKAGEILEKELKKRKIQPLCFVGPEVKVVPFVHYLAKRYQHPRYVILRKSIKGYMTSPIIIEYPSRNSPKHVKKLVLSGFSEELLLAKKEGIVLVDDVVSTGATMEMLEKLMTRIGVKVIAKCAIFKQGDIYTKDLIYLAELPIIQVKPK